MFTPLDAAHQTTLQTSPWSSAMVAAILAADIFIENNGTFGFQVRGDASVAAQAQTIIDTEADWLPFAKQEVIKAVKDTYDGLIAAGRAYSVAGGADTSQYSYDIDEVAPLDQATGQPTRQASLVTIDQVANMARRALANGVTGTPWDPNALRPFKFYDTNWAGVAMTPQQADEFTQNIGTYVNALKQNVLGLTAQILGATSAAALGAIDRTTGWPSNP